MSRTSAQLRRSPLEGAHRAAAPALLLLVLLLSADLLFVIADVVLNVFGLDPSPAMRLGAERGHPEFFQYIKLIWLLMILPLVAWRYRSWSLLAWVAPFGYLLIDDSNRVHERYGYRISTMLEISPRWGLRAQDFGELIVLGVAGLVSLVILVIGYAVAGRTVRRVFHDLIALVAILVFFGVAFDVVHSFTMGVPGDIVGVLEDGGEMVSISLIVAYVFHTAFSPTPTDLIGSVRRHRSARS